MKHNENGAGLRIEVSSLDDSILDEAPVEQKIATTPIHTQKDQVASKKPEPKTQKADKPAASKSATRKSEDKKKIIPLNKDYKIVVDTIEAKYVPKLTKEEEER